MALIKIKSESMNLADDYAFTGTVTGAGAGAWEVVNSSSSTNTSTFEVTGFDNGNDYYMILAKLQPVNASSTNHLMLQLGNDSGYYSFGNAIGTEIYAKDDNTDKSQNFSAVWQDNSRLQMTGNSFGTTNAVVSQCTGIFQIFTSNPYEATVYKHVWGNGNYMHDHNYIMRSTFTGIYDQNTQFKKAKIFYASGEGLKGTVTLYGRLNS